MLDIKHGIDFNAFVFPPVVNRRPACAFVRRIKGKRY